MPRKPYIWFSGAKYHIISRGNRKLPLFFDDEDRIKYFSLLREIQNQHPFILHAYCLMTNHVHLMIETLTTPPDQIMKLLNQKYALYFNRKYECSGHVFENRYTRMLLDSILYELDVSKYIHLNPLRAQMVTNLEDFPWSSYRAYVLGEKNPLVTTEYLLSYFLNPKAYHYKKYVHSPKADLTCLDLHQIVQLRRQILNS